jgi:hypothetical protein
MSHRDGYEHGVPSWIAGAHADPEQAAAFYTELFGWEAERRGDQIVCTLRGRDVAGFVRGDEPAWRTSVWVEAPTRPPSGRRPLAAASSPRRSTSPASGAAPSSPTPPARSSPSPSPIPTAAPRSSTSRARGR